MNRALFSGVAGMKTHQTRMDVIGNNIANVNTYGYKSQRAVFSDSFYQTLSAATAGTASTGGTNPSTVGYGAQLAAVQSQMTQSSMQSTGYGLDVAITGEGFLQVQDGDGNIFYTKAGMLDYDSNGYLTDVNGNFVLGTNTADGAAGSSKINLTNIRDVSAKTSSVTESLNNIAYTIQTANQTADGNFSLSFSSAVLASGQKAKATISDTGATSIVFNSEASFSNWADVNDAINAAILQAKGGEPSYGAVTISSDPNPFVDAKGDAAPHTGAELVGTDFAIQTGKADSTQWVDLMDGRLSFKGTGTGFTGITDGELTFEQDLTDKTGKTWNVTMTGKEGTYSGKISTDSTATSILLKNGSSNTDFLEISNPSVSLKTATGKVTASSDLDISAAAESTQLGLASKAFTMTGGTAGGAVTLDQLTNIAIGADGTITVTHPELGNVSVGKISLASFANTSGLQAEGTGYYSATVNSGDPILSDPGSNGTGGLKSSSLEMSNVDLAAEFADMITTQRGYQANARIITVSDTMLEELINLKR